MVVHTRVPYLYLNLLVTMSRAELTSQTFSYWRTIYNAFTLNLNACWDLTCITKLILQVVEAQFHFNAVWPLIHVRIKSQKFKGALTKMAGYGKIKPISRHQIRASLLNEAPENCLVLLCTLNTSAHNTTTTVHNCTMTHTALTKRSCLTGLTKVHWIFTHI